MDYDYDDDCEEFSIGPHLYLFEVVGHCVKVGITDDPVTRMKALEAQARKMGRTAGRVWITPRHHEARQNEHSLKDGSRSEYLKVDFAALVERAMALPMTTDDESDEDDFTMSLGFDMNRFESREGCGHG